MIKLEHIFKIYEVGEEKIFALNDVSLDIVEKEFIAIIGPSGSGKSTLMNILGCLDYPDKGHYFFDGIDVMNLSSDQVSWLRNNKIGFVFQNYNLISDLTAFENVELPLIYQGINGKKRKEMVFNSLDMVGLSKRVKHLPNQLSGGQQQRVAIARALITNPKIILADEPTGNLDSKSSQEIMNLLLGLNVSGKTVILITHNEDIAKLAMRRVHIRDGVILEEKTK